MNTASPEKLTVIQTISSSPKVLNRRLRCMAAFSRLFAPKVKEATNAPLR